MVVAIAIFAVVGVLAYGGLNRVLASQEHLQYSALELKNLQLAFRYIERDLGQLINRPIRNQYGDLQNALVGDQDEAFSFTHSGWRNPADLIRSRLQRVSYVVTDSTFTRYTWSQLDGAIANEYLETELLNNVQAFNVRYLDQANQWHANWPPLNTNINDSTIPKALEITIKVKLWDEIKRIFVAPT